MEGHIINFGLQTGHNIGEIGEISSARRRGAELAGYSGFDETVAGQLALLITEAGTNIAKHASFGHIYLRSITYGNAKGVEILAVDSGPGLMDPIENLLDGNSSSNTYGVGLGSMKRLSSEFEIYTQIDKGTVIYMTLWGDEQSNPPKQWLIGSISIPIQGEDVCGDAWTAQEYENGFSLLVADGLGHGPDAAKASILAVEVLDNNVGFYPLETMQKSHALLRSTRGAAVAVAKIDLNKSELRYAGIGNIAGTICQETSKQHLLSHNGIVGSNMRKTQEFIQDWTDDSILIMHSDGVSTKWNLNDYPRLQNQHPSIIAAVIHRDFSRKSDDSTIVVAKKT